MNTLIATSVKNGIPVYKHSFDIAFPSLGYKKLWWQPTCITTDLFNSNIVAQLMYNLTIFSHNLTGTWLEESCCECHYASKCQ